MGRRLVVAILAILGSLMAVGIASADQSAGVAIHPGAHTSFDRTYNWVVTKTDDQHGSVTIAQNEVFSIGYTITVSNGTPLYTDSNWVVQDGIPITSGAPFTLPALSSLVPVALQGATSTTGSVSVCSYDPLYASPLSFPLQYPGHNSTVGCHYTIPLPNGNAGTMTATATFADGSTASGSTPFDFVSGGAYLEEGQPVIKNAGPLDVVDSVQGPLGSVSAPIDALHPQTYQYSVSVPSGTCGSFDMPNTVRLIDHATGAVVASASDTVHVTVTCPHVNGCTLTQGYWKTHSIYGPASKPDPTWNLVGGPNAAFFSSGQTWLQVFNTSPAGGNAYYVLAHQYEAAVLNQLNGASSTAAVDSALASAKTFFQTYTPATAGALAKNSAARASALAAASTLDNYNSGLIGPGHCSENS